MSEQEVKPTEDRDNSEVPKAASKELAFSPFGKRIVIARKVTDVGGFKLTKELERECSPDIGTITHVGQVGFWNKWIRGIRVGRQVHFVKYSPVKIETTDYQYIYVNVDDILGISN